MDGRRLLNRGAGRFSSLSSLGNRHVLHIVWHQCTVLYSICSVDSWKRSNRLVQALQPFFLNLILLGCLISSSSITPLIQQSEGDDPVVACAVFPWLFCVGFSVTFGTLFAKIHWIYKLFKASAQAARITTVTKKETLIIICMITSVDILICTIWTAMSPLQWSRVVTSADQFGDPFESIGFCTGMHWKAFLSIIAAWHFSHVYAFLPLPGRGHLD